MNDVINALNVLADAAYKHAGLQVQQASLLVQNFILKVLKEKEDAGKDGKKPSETGKQEGLEG